MARWFWSALWLVRWYSESARWLVLNRRSEDALKSLHRVARINGKPEMIDKLTLEVTCLVSCLPDYLSHHLSHTWRVIQSAAELRTMWPAGAALSHEQRDRVKSFIGHSIRPPEDKSNETHLYLSDCCLVRKHICFTCIHSPAPVFIHLYLLTCLSTCL